MTELEKLKQYLDTHGIPNKAVKSARRNQIIVFNEDGERLWDVISQRGSYGFEEGLLEGMGVPGGDRSLDVEGWLTADEIIKRLEEQ